MCVSHKAFHEIHTYSFFSNPNRKTKANLNPNHKPNPYANPNTNINPKPNPSPNPNPNTNPKRNPKTRNSYTFKTMCLSFNVKILQRKRRLFSLLTIL